MSTETAVPDAVRFPVQGQFNIYSEQAAVPNDNIGSSGTQFTDPGATVYYNDQFHMFHNAFTGWPAPVDVMYSVASSPFGPWTARNQPVLTSGSTGEWDDLAVRAPSVVATDEGYVMFYAGFQRNSANIGQAFSDDGITWTKYDDPETTEAPYAESDPTFTGVGSGWDSLNVYQPRVRLTDDGWVMLYTSSNQVTSGSLNQAHGLAFSADGREWTRSETAVFRPGDVRSTGLRIWYTELEYALGTYYIFFELGTGGETEIYVATFDGSLLPK